MKKPDLTLIAVSLGHGITHWYPATLYIVLPSLAADLGLTYSQVGFLMGWNSFSSFFVNLPGGLIVDLVGKTRLLLGLALALIGLQSLLSGLSPVICGFIADRFGILHAFYFLAFTIFAANFLVYLIPEKPPKEEVLIGGEIRRTRSSLEIPQSLLRPAPPRI